MEGFPLPLEGTISGPFHRLPCVTALPLAKISLVLCSPLRVKNAILSSTRNHRFFRREIYPLPLYAKKHNAVTGPHVSQLPLKSSICLHLESAFPYPTRNSQPCFEKQTKCSLLWGWWSNPVLEKMERLRENTTQTPSQTPPSSYGNDSHSLYRDHFKIMTHFREASLSNVKLLG